MHLRRVVAWHASGSAIEGTFRYYQQHSALADFRCRRVAAVAFELQWPARWESFWPMVFGLLPRSVQMIDVFLRILDPGPVPGTLRKDGP